MIATDDSKGLALLTRAFSGIGALNPAAARVIKCLHYRLDEILELGFKTFRCALMRLAGIELIHIIANAQMNDRDVWKTPAEQCYSPTL